MIKTIINTIKSQFVVTCVDDIIKPFNKMLVKLEKFEDKLVERACNIEAEIDTAQAKKRDTFREIQKLKTLRNNMKGLVG
jgi:hypothetical protein